MNCNSHEGKPKQRDQRHWKAGRGEVDSQMLPLAVWSGANYLAFPSIGLLSSKTEELVVSDSCNPWTVAHQAPLSLELCRQEYWSGLPFPFPGILPTQGSNPGLRHGRQIPHILSHQGSVHLTRMCNLFPSFPQGCIYHPPSAKRSSVFGVLQISKDDEMVGWHHQLDGHEFE